MPPCTEKRCCIYAEPNCCRHHSQRVCLMRVSRPTRAGEHRKSPNHSINLVLVILQDRTGHPPEAGRGVYQVRRGQLGTAQKHMACPWWEAWANATFHAGATAASDQPNPPCAGSVRTLRLRLGAVARVGPDTGVRRRDGGSGAIQQVKAKRLGPSRVKDPGPGNHISSSCGPGSRHDGASGKRFSGQNGRRGWLKRLAASLEPGGGSAGWNEARQTQTGCDLDQFAAPGPQPIGHVPSEVKVWNVDIRTPAPRAAGPGRNFSCQRHCPISPALGLHSGLLLQRRGPESGIIASHHNVQSASPVERYYLGCCVTWSRPDLNDSRVPNPPAPATDPGL
ncbi:hypothetical protein BT67DRAFT_300650 [Trichocladium antarcticum]|uniref:Uncharacterized protein n=1 Tax=Trichocladium antarcticum TaxID=1450529 RepID=A0AAN6UKW3_9PEZI|nr:hypothetical protein BT67DRAFT_300650 [Trichocladium antarcticum]